MSKAFNIRIIEYASGGCQLRHYSSPVGAPVESTKESQFPDDGLYYDESNDKYYPLSEITYNPFSGEYEYLRTSADAEHSKNVSYNRTKNRIYYLARSNKWDWFVTLTFNPEKVNSFDYVECVKYLSKWLNNCKRKASDMKYLVVPEKHKSGRYHFHALFADCDALKFADSGKRDKSGKIIYNIGSYKLGFTTATRVENCEKVSKYISKYVTKDLCCLASGKKRYWASRNLAEAPQHDFLLSAEEIRQFFSRFDSMIKYRKQVNAVSLNEYKILKSGVLQVKEGFTEYIEFSEEFDFFLLKEYFDFLGGAP